jgi:hypothetical protein
MLDMVHTIFIHIRDGKRSYMLIKYQVKSFKWIGYKAGKVVYTIIDDATRWTYVKTYETTNAINTVSFLKNVLKRSYFKINLCCGPMG